MWVEYYNHLPQCREVAKGVDVRWGQEKGGQLVAEELAKRGAKKVGVIGPLNGAAWKGIQTKVPLVSLGREYVELRLVKSEEEIQWMRIGGALSDLGMRTLIAGTKVGMSEHELSNMIERSYVGIGGTIGIHFIGSTPMSAPDCCVPRQYHTRRTVKPGLCLLRTNLDVVRLLGPSVARLYCRGRVHAAIQRPSCHCRAGLQQHHKNYQ